MLTEIRSKTLSQLKSYEGSLWKEVQGEVHAQFDEIPTWILLYEDSDIEEAHMKFREIVAPYMDKAQPAQFSVSYTIYSDDDEISVDFLSDNQEILDGSSGGLLGSYRERGPKPKVSVFKAQVSGRKGNKEE